MAPSDYEVEDGELAMGMGMVVEDGVMQPLEQPKQLFSLAAGQEVVYIHATATYKHFIVRDGDGKLYLVNGVDNEGVAVLVDIYTFTQGVIKVNSNGNTLIVLSGDGLHYLLWRSTTNQYFYLGQKPEMLELSFGLSENKSAHYDEPSSVEPHPDPESTYLSAYANTGHLPSTYLDINSSHTIFSFKESKVDELNDVIMALVNKTNAKITNDGHFYAPFFVRYCYRLYDGTMWMHSAPVYMPVSMPFSYHVEIPTAYQKDGVISSTFHPYIIDENFYRIELNNLHFRYKPQNVSLMCKLIGGSVSTLLNDWNDIIKSVDIFVSQPIIREDSGEKIKTASIAKKSYKLASASLLEYNYTVQSDPFYYTDAANEIHNIVCNIPLLSEDAYMDKIRNIAAFYKVKSIDLNQFDIPSDHYGEIEINKEVLPNLATQEQMDDDYKSHNLLLPFSDENGNVVTSLFSYNERENIAAVKEKLFEGFAVKMLAPYCTSYPNIDSTYDRKYYIGNIYVKLRTEEGDKIVKWESNFEPTFVRNEPLDTGEIVKQMLYNCPLFYPDRRATDMYLDVKKYTGITYSSQLWHLPMKEHAFLNGAITSGGIMSSMQTSFESADIPEITNDELSYPNKLYTSEVNNPFIFKATGINTIGTGLILGLASATKALSEGQFGQFPLYTLTTEGVWALTVAGTGAFVSAHPVSRDVCISADSITPLDNSVLFATDRGIMRIVGSETVCISDKINDEQPFNVMTLPGASELLTGNYAVTTPVPFKTFLDGCRMAYDYRHHRVYLFNPQVTGYAYIYSLTSRQWTLVDANLTSAVNSYPAAMVMAKDTDDNPVFINLSERALDTAAEICHGVLVTRPLKLGAGDILKTVKTVVQLGYFQRGEVKTVLYGSRDLFHWYLIASSQDQYIRGLHGTPYKYFRIMALVDMDRGRNLSGVRFEYEQKSKNVLH